MKYITYFEQAFDIYNFFLVSHSEIKKTSDQCINNFIQHKNHSKTCSKKFHLSHNLQALLPTIQSHTYLTKRQLGLWDYCMISYIDLKLLYLYFHILSVTPFCKYVQVRDYFVYSSKYTGITLANKKKFLFTKLFISFNQVD